MYMDIAKHTLKLTYSKMRVDVTSVNGRGSFIVMQYEFNFCSSATVALF